MENSKTRSRHMDELPIIQKTYDLIQWYVPHINRMPRDMKFALGDRMQSNLYDLLEGLILARYDSERLPLLQRLNARLDILRFHTRLCRDFELLSTRRYEYASEALHEIGQQLGNWIKQQKRKAT